jgi:hypothetical protein
MRATVRMPLSPSLSLTFDYWFDNAQLPFEISMYISRDGTLREGLRRLKRTANAKEAAIAALAEERLDLVDRMNRKAQPRRA